MTSTVSPGQNGEGGRMTTQPPNPRDAELLARFRALPVEARKCIIDWLADAGTDAMLDDPSVGIFASPDMAEGFRILDQLAGSGELGRKVPA